MGIGGPTKAHKSWLLRSCVSAADRRPVLFFWPQGIGFRQPSRRARCRRFRLQRMTGIQGKEWLSYLRICFGGVALAGRLC